MVIQYVDARRDIARNGDIWVAVTVQVRNPKSTCVTADRIGHLRLEGAVAVTEENAGGRIRIVGDHHVLLAISIQVAGYDKLDLETSREDLLRLKSAIAITQQHTYTANIVVHHA